VSGSEESGVRCQRYKNLLIPEILRILRNVKYVI